MRIRYIAAIVGLTALGACQTDAPPSFFGPTVPASNELHALGRQELASGNYGLAETHFRRAVEANSEDGPSWVGLAAAYDNLGRFDLADRAYDEATRIEGESLAILNNRGYSLYLRGQRAKALSIFRRALSLYPGQPALLNNIALAQRAELPTRAAAP